MSSLLKGGGRVSSYFDRWLKKLINRYLTPYIEQQKLVNSSLCYNIEEIQCDLSVLHIDLRSLTEQLQINTEQFQNKVEQINQDFNRLSAEISNHGEQISVLNEQLTQTRMEVKNCVQVPIFLISLLEARNEIDSALQLTLTALRAKRDHPALLAKAQTLYKKRVSTKLNSPQNQPGNIIILCQNFKQEQTIEAIKKEAWNLFSALKDTPIGSQVKFVSLEDAVTSLEYLTDQDVYCCPTSNIETFLAQLSPSVVHVLGTDAWILFRDQHSLFKFNLIATLSGCNPLGNIDDYKIAEIRHQMDHGSLEIVVEAAPSLVICQNNHLPRTQLLYPVVNLGAEEKLPDAEEKHIDAEDKLTEAANTALTQASKPFCVGFASSPMLEEQDGARGVDLLLQVAAVLPEVSFRIAWRNPQVNIEDRIAQLGLDNIHLELGFIDMDRFYESVECMVLPYTSCQNNHACPLSAVEAVLLGIPVICTHLVGSSEVIASRKLGLMVNPVVNDLVTAVQDIRQGKCMPKEKIQETARDIFNREKVLEAYLSSYHQLSSQPPAMPLAQWRQVLQQAGQELIKGRENLVSYYTEQDIAKKYTTTRFTEFPMNCYDIFEREAVKQIIISWQADQKLIRGKGYASSRLLDIAAGDGRILQELLPFGHCTAIDTSPEMLKIAQDRCARILAQDRCARTLAQDQCAQTDNVEIVLADLFEFQADKPFEVITCFRLLRHLDYAERQAVYRQIRALLTEEGIIIFDYPNRTAELALREKTGWHKYNIYDVFWTEESMRQEVTENELELYKYLPVGEGLLPELDGELQVEPLIWVAALKKRKPRITK